MFAGVLHRNRILHICFNVDLHLNWQLDRRHWEYILKSYFRQLIISNNRTHFHGKVFDNAYKHLTTTFSESCFATPRKCASKSIIETNFHCISIVEIVNMQHQNQILHGRIKINLTGNVFYLHFTITFSESSTIVWTCQVILVKWIKEL